MSKRIIPPISAILLLMVGILVGFKFQSHTAVEVEGRELTLDENLKKFQTIVQRVQESYFKPVDQAKLFENAIVGMLEKLDPHTFYIPPADMQGIQESMQGSFDGIGVEFNIMEDTIVVVSPISGGPSERLGIMPGDRIVEVEGEKVAGTGITNEQVFKKLRGPKGSTVHVKIVRPGMKSMMEFAIVRDKIPLNSVDYAYMVDNTTGYIKVNRFSETTMNEFLENLMALKAKGLKNLILDLRFNPGGYLEMAQMMADVFLKRGQMIVYTEGRVEGTNKQYIASTRFSEFEEGGLVVLINQGSASASEIVSGSIQDHDRGLIVGTRSFGKGLVQQQYPLMDGSAIRVVVSRYFTPSGRCIQKPFDQGTDEYNEEVEHRVDSGELFDPTNIHFPDSLKFKTDAGRTVYGGGGIMPDVFVPADTAGRSDYLEKLVAKNLFRMFVFRYAENHSAALKQQYPSGLDYAKRFDINDPLMREFTGFAAEHGVALNQQGMDRSRKVIQDNLKALLGRNLYGDEGFYPTLHQHDEVFQSALRLMPKAVELARSGKFENPTPAQRGGQSNNGR